MNTKEISSFVVLAIIFLLLFVAAHVRVLNLRTEFSHSLKVSAAPIPPDLLKALAVEFKGVLANYLLLEAASFIGGNTEADEHEWNAVARLLDQSSILDPYFKQTYSLAQGTLPWYAQSYDETLTILERSRQNRTWDWLPGFFIGFNHYYFLEDYETASQALMEASNISGAPAVLATWAALLASKIGRHQAAIEFLIGMYESTEDQMQKELLAQRIEALQGAYFLQQAVNHFQEQFDRIPDSLDELVDRGILSELPANPYNRSYSLNEGIVEF